MRYSLLELVQDVLYSMDGDEVSSITDNYESTQTAHIARTVYLDILTRSGLPETQTIFQLSASDNTTPLLMTLPSGIKDIYSVKYDYATADDTDKQYTPIYFQDLDTFLKRSHQLDQSDDNVDLMTISGSFGDIDILYRNDIAPSFYTSYDDRNILFDAIDISLDTSNLLSAKTQCFGTQSPSFTFSNDFSFPLIDEDQMPLLLAECKALAWAEMKQASNSKAEQSARRNWIAQPRNKEAVKGEPAINRLPNYGRK